MGKEKPGFGRSGSTARTHACTRAPISLLVSAPFSHGHRQRQRPHPLMATAGPSVARAEGEGGNLAGYVCARACVCVCVNTASSTGTPLSVSSQSHARTGRFNSISSGGGGGWVLQGRAGAGAGAVAARCVEAIAVGTERDEIQSIWPRRVLLAWQQPSALFFPSTADSSSIGRPGRGGGVDEPRLAS